MSMPKLEDWHTWVVSMVGDEITVALHNKHATGRTGTRIRFGIVRADDVIDCLNEQELLDAVEERAGDVLHSHEMRQKREGWMRDNFS